MKVINEHDEDNGPTPAIIFTPPKRTALTKRWLAQHRRDGHAVIVQERPENARDQRANFKPERR